MAAPAPAPPTATKKKASKTPQGGINEFWSKFSSKKPSKVTSIFPRLLYASLLPQHPDPRGLASARNARESYEAAARECRAKVDGIVRECHRTNEKFTDNDFDIEGDTRGNCLNGLSYVSEDDDGDSTTTSSSRNTASATRRGGGDPEAHQRGHGGIPREDGVEAGGCYSPGSVHRLHWLFKDPQFTIDGFSSSDIQQGGNGDCWWLAAVATIANRKDLMERVCVARDEECGVYGFVFYRDGEWVSTVVDDNLYLKAQDFRDQYTDVYDPTGERAKKHKLQNQTGSEALYFGHCADPNETWLPLLEKAYAKAHGDYDALAYGWSGEGVEDMTGGVTTTIVTKRVLRKERLWKELAFGDGEFVFALSAMGSTLSASGVILGHAYSILRATEEVKEDGTSIRLVQVRNPWGQRNPYNRLGEWDGAWSDGAREWTPYLMKKLNHRFGDDGVFWMPYDDMLETFKYLHRTRVFGQNWHVIQQWNSCDVSWFTGYLRTKFVVDVKTAGTVVIVLAQLDERYFRGLAGQYRFSLHFLLKKEGSSPEDYICRVRPAHEWENRSVSCEVDLEPGRYEVLPKITATRAKDEPTLDMVVKQFAERNPQKLRQIGMQYDLAHAKGGIEDEDLKIVSQKEKERQKAIAQKKKGKASKQVSVEVKIDIDGASKTEVSTEVGDKAKAQEREAEKFEDAAENIENEGREKPKDQTETGTERALELRPKGQAEGDTKGDAVKTGDGGKSNDDEAVDSGKEKKKDDGKNDKGKKEDEKKEKDSESSDASDATDSEEDDEDGSRWNAVCVTCLRVYSQDKDLTISLMKPESAEEASSLVQGDEPAGATM